MTATSESEEVRALYVGNLHQYVNEAMLQVRPCAAILVVLNFNIKGGF